MNETKNDKGGVQHERPYMAEALQYKAILEMAKVRYEACKIRGLPEDNWRNIPQREHIARALQHLDDAMAGNGRVEKTTKANLSHAMTRIGFALEMELDKEDEENKSKENTENTGRCRSRKKDWLHLWRRIHR